MIWSLTIHMILQLSSTERKKYVYMCRDQMRGLVWLMDFQQGQFTYI